MYIQKVKSNKLRKNNNFLLASCKSLTKIARSEAGPGYISTSRGSGPLIQSVPKCQGSATLVIEGADDKLGQFLGQVIK